MENFFVRRKEVWNFSDKSYLYDMGARVEHHILHSGDIRIELPFTPTYLRNLPFDFFLISDDQSLYRINKHKLDIEDIGYVTDSIRAVECGPDRIIIATDKEFLLFNAYFDLVKSRSLSQETECSSVSCRKDDISCCVERHAARNGSCLESSSDQNACKNVYKIVDAGDLFGYIESARMMIYDSGLEPVGAVNEAIFDAVYIPRYNRFACATLCSIRFFEPNGLEHGDPIDVKAKMLQSMTAGGCSLLVAGKGCEISIFYMKNFFWYKKLVINGELLQTENSTVIVAGPESITRFFVYREKSSNFVIDGHRLYYTNLRRAIVPPPFYFKCIEMDSQITGFYFDGSLLCVSDLDKACVFSIDKDDMINKVKTLGRLGDDFIAAGDAFLLKSGGSVEIVGPVSSQIKLFVRRADEMSKKSPILRLYSFGGFPACLFYNGIVLFDDVYRFDVSLEHSFDLQISFEKSKMYLLGSGHLHAVSLSRGHSQCASLEERIGTMFLGIEGQPVLSAVASYLLHRKYILYISKHVLSVLDCDTGTKWEGYSEEGTEVLAVKDNKIILYTRFGTLETLTCKLFGRALARDLISHNRLREAAQLCDASHISYSIFFESGSFDLTCLSQFDDSHALSLFEAMGTGWQIALLENEYLERLERNFNPSVVLRDQSFEIVDSGCIHIASVNHIFADISQMPLKIKDTKHLRHCDFLHEQKNASDLVDGRPSVDFLNSFLRSLDVDKHFVTIVNVLMTLNRVDLCFYLPNPHRAIKILLTKLSPESVSRESIRTLSIEKMVLAHKACQRDYTSLMKFYNSCENTKHSLSDYLEDRASALFYMVENSTPEDTKHYAVKYGLLDHLLLYTYHSVFDMNFYEPVAQHKDPLDAFYLYRMSGNRQKALEVAAKNVLWREAIELDASADNCALFLSILTKNSMFLEAGTIYESNEDYVDAIKFYIKGRGISKAFALLESPKLSAEQKDSMVRLLRKASGNYLRSDIETFKDLTASFKGYVERLQAVRDRLNENMNITQTTLSNSSMKSFKRALIKDRPGGVFENEYVLNKIREVVLEIDSWRRQTEPLIEIFLAFGDEDMISVHNDLFKPMKETLRREVERMWSYERTDFDLERPLVSKPELSRYFD